MPRKFNPAELQGAAAMFYGQKSAIPSSTLDPNFPVLSGTAGKCLTVYIPQVNIWEMPDGSIQEILYTFRLHEWATATKSFGVINCISGLTDMGIKEQLKNGYAVQAKDENGQPMFNSDGQPVYEHKDCPACAAEKKCNQLADLKLQYTALQKGPNVDPNSLPDATKDSIRGERVIKYSREFVVFPIVVIPTNDNGEPTVKSVSDLKVYFVRMAKKRYQEKVCAGLNSGLKKVNKPKFLGGNFMTWDFCSSQAANNQKLNARDAAQNATFTIIKDADDLEVLTPLKDMCEKAAEEFTQQKATLVVRDVQCIPYNEMVSKVKALMKETEDSIVVFQNKLNGVTPNAVPALSSPDDILKSWSATIPTTPTTTPSPATPTTPTTPITPTPTPVASPEQLMAAFSAETAGVQDTAFGGQRFTVPTL